MGIYNDIINQKLMNETLYSTEPFVILNTLTGEYKSLPPPKLRELTDEELYWCKKELNLELKSNGFEVKTESSNSICISKDYFSFILNTDGIFPYTSVLIHQINKAYEHGRYGRGEL